MKRILSIFVMVVLLGSVSISAHGEATVHTGIVQGIDGEAIVVEDASGIVWTFFFGDLAPRSALPGDIEIGSNVAAIYTGEMNEYDQLLDQPFVIFSTEHMTTFVGVVRGIDGEAITVEDASGIVWTFFFNDFTPRSELPEEIEIGSNATVIYTGEMNEYNQLLDRPFVIRAATALDGIVRGFDGEAITVEDASGIVWTFFYSDFAPITLLPEGIDIGSNVTVIYSGDMNEYDQLIDQPFVIRMAQPAERP